MKRQKTYDIRSKGDKTIDRAIVVIVSLLILTIMYPLWYVLIASVSTVSELAAINFPLLPQGFTFDSYKLVFENPLIWKSLLNSVLYLIVGVTINIIMTVLAAYPLSRDDLIGRKKLIKLIIVTMYISGGLIPSYLLIRDLNMLNTFLVMVIPMAVSAFYIIIAISFFRSTIPKNLEDAALIDGCNNFTLLFKIVLPLSMPLLGVLMLNYGLGHWNSYTHALVYLTDRGKFPLQLVLREILTFTDSQTMTGMVSGSQAGQMMAGTTGNYDEMLNIQMGIKYVLIVFSSAPLLILSPFLTKFFAKGITLGAVKE